MSGVRYSRPDKIATLLAAFWLLSPGAFAEPVKLPETAPVPETHVPAQHQELPAASPDIPLPEAKPGEDGAAETSAPDEPPIPEAKSDIGPPPAGKPQLEPEEPAPPPDPRSAVRPDPSGKLPADELACRGRLKTLGVEFQEHAAESDPLGCAIPYPLILKSLGKEIGLEADAEMNCAMAEASAHFMRDVVSPAAKTEMGKDLKSVSNGSAFVCRPRNGTRRLSEHAFGNALDISAFTLSDGSLVEIGPVPEEKAAKFLAAVRKAACGPFKTVLGPGSDPDHATHLHLDLAPRRNGGTFCQ